MSDEIKVTQGGNKKPKRLKPCPRCGSELELQFVFLDGQDRKTGKRWGRSGYYPHCPKCNVTWTNPEDVTEEMNDNF